MDLKNTPLKEKFNMLSYLQKEVTGAGNFLIQHLKTKNKFQISFINGLLFSSKSDDVDICVEEGIIELASHYSCQNQGKDFYSSYQMQNDIDMYKKRIIELEDKVVELEDNYSRDISDVNKVEFYNFHHKSENIETKKKRGRPSKKQLTEVVFDDSDGVPTMRDATDKEKVGVNVVIKKKIRESKSKLYTEAQLYKEIKRLHPVNLKFMQISDKKLYKELRLKAYKRLTTKKYAKISERKQNLTIGENKYNITTSDVIEEMKRNKPTKYLDSLSNVKYIKEWTKAKSRVWNREYTKAKTYGENPWG